ncbi:polysaccharide biosynthesis protein [Pseudomonas massiliensis]|uniref:polysaccharide biosynthesis protein n=1 Tax=Pseudomonas massiliensis TaxID=522492 RepID=UPI00058D3109|nr:nucleoside-diphosphate sugar epimerase/dehydratase [Pseudomonas massiliensis]
MNALRLYMLALPRRQKRLLQVVVDILLVWLALWLAFVVRLGIEDLISPLGDYMWLFIAAPVISIPLFIRLGMYRAVLRYFGNDALLTIAKAVTLAALILALAIFWYSNHKAMVPRSVIFNYWWLSLVILGGLRLAMRQFFLGDWFAGQHLTSASSRDEGLTRVAVYGAGVAGNQLVAGLRMGRLMRPVAFIDDDPSLSRRVIAGLQVYKPRHIERMIEETGATEILLALPSSSRARRREILEFLESFPLHVRSVPNLSDLASGRVKVEDIQEIDIADLLGRDAVPPMDDLLEKCIEAQVVMVTGAGGSIGAELCRQIICLKPSRLIIFDHGEYNLYCINEELQKLLRRHSFNVEILPILGTVKDEVKLEQTMRTWKVETVYHAAAYKHVPIVEHNIAEGVLNNVFGTLYSAQAALRAGVPNFVLISTDKAVRPTNVMGSTKRMAELILQALSAEVAPRLFDQSSNVAHVNKTRFSMVRFGNVLGSSGSVIPLFHKQIRAGGPLTVTHPKITRYFMTIPEAAQLVIQAGSLGKGGEVFVLDMGEPVLIAELAEKMIKLSGLSVRSERNPYGDIAIEYTGLRPGEKLYEELLIGDNVSPTRHPMIMCANEEAFEWAEFKLLLEKLQAALRAEDLSQVRVLLRYAVAGYEPQQEIVDWFHVQHRLDAD